MYGRMTTTYRPQQYPQLPGHENYADLFRMGSAIAQNNSGSNRPQSLNYDAAVRQAQAALDPGFNRMLNNTLQNIDRNSIARGFYGQMPMDVFKRATAGDLSMQHQANIAQYANQLQQQSFQNQLAYDQLNLQKQQYSDQQNGQFWQTLAQIAGVVLPLLL